MSQSRSGDKTRDPQAQGVWVQPSAHLASLHCWVLQPLVPGAQCPWGRHSAAPGVPVRGPPQQLTAKSPCQVAVLQLRQLGIVGLTSIRRKSFIHITQYAFC